jgi:SSS family solute:Na+ symporter
MLDPTLATYGFTWLDWLVLIGYLTLTTVLGAKLAGKNTTIREFFLGGRKLPWWAVAGSIIATEISAVTFVSVPSVVFKPGGDLRYFQHALFGALFARVIVALVLVPAYYQREIYSPYDYMGHKLGAAVKKVTTALFSLGGILAQSSRVYLTAVVLEVVLGPSFFAPVQQALGIDPVIQSIVLIGVIAIVWTLLGGITTVIWTDVILFGVFFVGALAALGCVVWNLDGGFAELFRVGWEAGKFRLLDFDTDPTKTYTVIAAAFGTTLGNIGIFGTDQLMAQRVFCCKNARDAQKAMIASWLGNAVTLTVMLVGIALYAYYAQHPMTGDTLASYQANTERIFPIFIVQVIPPGLTGLIIAGIFAAAISSLDSILAALAQTSLSAIWQPLRRRKLGLGQDEPFPPDEDVKQVAVGRWFIVIAGVVLTAAAIGMIEVAKSYKSILDLALAMAGYTSGALLAGFLLAFLPQVKVDGFGYCFAAPLSAVFVYALVWHNDASAWFSGACGFVAVLIYCACCARGVRGASVAKLPWLVLAVLLILAANRWGTFTRIDANTGTANEIAIAFPYQAPLGALFAFVFALVLGRPRTAALEPAR